MTQEALEDDSVCDIGFKTTFLDYFSEAGFLTRFVNLFSVIVTRNLDVLFFEKILDHLVLNVAVLVHFRHLGVEASLRFAIRIKCTFSLLLSQHVFELNQTDGFLCLICGVDWGPCLVRRSKFQDGFLITRSRLIIRWKGKCLETSP